MRINADFSSRVIVRPHQYRWVESPQRGVERVMLDRVGAEQARATSLVRYAPDSYFPGHSRPQGEEILVLSGTFSEDDHHYGAGWYLRSPPGSSHQPYSQEGATIFVKLRQMPAYEKTCVRLDTNAPCAWRQQDDREVCTLFKSDYEYVCLQRLAAGARLFKTAVKNAEILVLNGHLMVNNQSCEQGTWLRFPAGEFQDLTAGPGGVTVYLKQDHLANPTRQV